MKPDHPIQEALSATAPPEKQEIPFGSAACPGNRREDLRAWLDGKAEFPGFTRFRGEELGEYQRTLEAQDGDIKLNPRKIVKLGAWFSRTGDGSRGC